MRRLSILVLSLILSGWTAHALPPACGPALVFASQALQTENVARRAACEESYRENNCAELAKAEESADKILNCENLDEYPANQAILGCGYGLGVFAWDTVKGIVTSPYYLAKGVRAAPSVMADAIRDAASCHSNLDLKRALLAPLEDVLDQEIKNNMVETLNCEQLRELVQRQSQELENSIQVKERKNQPLNDSELKYKISANRLAQATPLMQEIVRELACFKPVEAGAEACKILAAVMSGVGVGRMALSATGRAIAGRLMKRAGVGTARGRAEMILGRELNDAQAAAVERAHLVGSGEPGLYGRTARIGEYTPEQLLKKDRILKEAGFSETDRRRLIKGGAVGEPAGVGRALSLTGNDAERELVRYEQLARKSGGSTTLAIGSQGNKVKWNLPPNINLPFGIKSLNMSHNAYIHVRRHFISTDNLPKLSQVTKGDPDTLKFLEEASRSIKDGKKPVLLSNNPEEAIAAQVKLSMEKGAWNNARVDPHTGYATVDVFIPDASNRIVVCASDICRGNHARGDIVTIIPLCGPAVFDLMVEEGLNANRNGVEHPINILRARRC